VSELISRWQQVRLQVQQALHDAGRADDAAMLLAVSKRHPASAIAELFQAGQCSFGESYLQEALDKQAELGELAIDWHFIGPIQSNKTRAIAENFSWVHSVDRLKVARRLSEQRPEGLADLNICVQVNVSNEASKSGFTLIELRDVVKEIAQLPRLRLRGLMAIPQRQHDPILQRQPFSALAKAQADLNASLGLNMDTLSMGMSADLSAAIAEGSTIVRVGTDIFGVRE
jgi:pyridoxal phosphate enzyme (YggS family)